MSVLEVSGKLIKKFDEQQINDTFKKREFVIEISETSPSGMTFTNFASFQLMQNNVNLIDRFQEGDDLKVSFNIRGNKWEKNGETRYITNLNAWRVEPMIPHQQQGQMPPQGYSQQNFGQQTPPPSQNFPPQQPPPQNPNMGSENNDIDLPF